MKRAVKLGGLGVVGLLVAAQFVRPSHVNPPIEQKSTIAAHLGKSSALAAVLDRSCNECHSNATSWPSYTQIAPLSWVAASAVKEARQTLNFSEWSRYTPGQQQLLLQASCDAASSGKMPGAFYTALEPRARLSAEDVRTICAASRGQEVAALEKLK